MNECCCDIYAYNTDKGTCIFIPIVYDEDVALPASKIIHLIKSILRSQVTCNTIKYKFKPLVSENSISNDPTGSIQNLTFSGLIIANDINGSSLKPNVIDH
jgi:hypothetical protein